MYFINIDGRRIYKANIESGEPEILVDEGAGEFSLVDGWIYYTKEYTPDSLLFRIRSDGTSKDLIFNEPCYSINIDGDRVYVIKRRQFSMEHEIKRK